MTDKVQKIREEVERIQLYTQSEVLKQVLDYIDKVQKEPVSSIWHDASEPPIIDKTFLLIAPNGNSSLCLWGGKKLHSVTIGGGHSVLCKGDIYSYIDDLLNLDNSCNFGKNLQEKSVSENLGEYINELSKQFPEASFAKLSRIAVRVANWQKEKDEEEKVLTYKHGFNDCKEQFEKNRLAACDKQTEEEAEIEQSFVMGIIENEHRQPTFDDAIKYGMRLQRENMMKGAFEFTEKHDTACVLASECLRNHGWFGRERDFNDLFRHLSCVDELFEGKFRGKTKVIVIKED